MEIIFLFIIAVLSLLLWLERRHRRWLEDELFECRWHGNVPHHHRGVDWWR